MNDVRVLIRTALPADAPAMARLIVDTWFAAHADQVPPAALDRRRESWGYAESERGWRRAIGDAGDGASCLLVATINEEIVGVLAAEKTGQRCAEVGALYVDLAHQRSGIGQRLFDAAVERLRDQGVSTLHIAVLTANLPARCFYERLGGRPDHERDHEDGPELVYSWQLAVD